MQNQNKNIKSKLKSDLAIRMRTGVIYAACVLLGSLLGNFATMIMVVIASGISAYEFYFMLRSDAKLPNETLGIIAAVAFPICFYFFNIKGVIVVTVVFIVTLLI